MPIARPDIPGRPQRLPFPQNLRSEREAAGLNQEELALILDMPQSKISKIESGKQKMPADLAPAWAAALQITISRLYGEPQRIYAKAG